MRLLATFVLLASSLANCQSWTSTPRCPIQPSTMLLLRDGRVLAQEGSSGKIAILAPDASGSYEHGIWNTVASLPDGYGPFQFSSVVLPDGRALFEGGEDNFGQQNYTNLGAIYDPRMNTWTPVAPPANWKTIGDAAGVLLPNGVYMQANCCAHDTQTAFFNPKDLSWTPGPNGLSVNQNEMGWTLLPNDTVLEVASETLCGTDQGSQIYQPSTNSWVCGPVLPQQLYSYQTELGSTVLTYNGEVLQVSGGDVYATAILNLAGNTWANGPALPDTYNQDDGPSAVEPNGKVLVMLGDKHLPISCHFVEFDPSSNTLEDAPNPPECPNGGDAVPARLLVLPTGQIMFAYWDNTPRLYNPAPGQYQAAAPYIYASVLVLYSGAANNVLVGTQLNGLSQAGFYGDDYQGATNYPLVQLIDVRGHVWYAPTHDDSYNGVAPNKFSTTKFDMPLLPIGPYTLRVVTNGIVSNDVPITIGIRH